jgi:hypothetical protein
MAQGHLHIALASYQASFVIAERLAKSDPSNAGWQRDLSLSYARLASAYLATMQSIKARVALSTGRNILTRLVTQFPDRAQWKQELAWFDQQIAALKN